MRCQLDQARNCYEQRAWAEAYQAFSLADQEKALEAEDLEQLALAAYLIGRDDEYLSALERAHYAHLNVSQCARAVRCAFWIGFRLLMRGEAGRASGWLGVPSDCSIKRPGSARSVAICCCRSSSSDLTG
jgi:hypothetical protein